MKNFLKTTFLILLAILASFFGKAQEGQDLFTKLCSPCHTIGKGRLVGPDLKNISERRTEEWLIPLIQSSQTVIKSGDAEAVANYNEYNKILMPDQPLNGAQVKVVLAYIAEVSSGEFTETTNVVPPDILENTTEQNIADGLLLFTGKKRLANAGSSCISCHTVKDDRVFSSGTLAKELTLSHEVMGSAGVAAILNNPPFPAMGVSYKNHPLTEEEVLNLTAYLRSVSQNHIYQHPVDFGVTFAIFGIIVFLGLLISMILFYYNRKKDSVNDEIHNRQSAVIN